MSFLYPLGLLGLIGIPVIIIIYILKNKYTEQIVTSTYLWELSEKFLKKKKHVSILSGFFSLLLQIAAIATLSLLIAHPVITIKDKAKEYCFILDGSGSMGMVTEEGLRIDIAKNKIKEIINNSYNGSTFTLVIVNDSSKIVYEDITDREKACELTDGVVNTGNSVDFKNSLKYAQERFNNNKSLQTYLITDKDYETNNINLINVSNHEDNYSLYDVKYLSNGKSIELLGKVLSYESDESLKINVYVDGVLEKEDLIKVSKLESKSFNYRLSKNDFDSIKVVIENEDGFIFDNNYEIYNVEKEHQYKTLLVSDNPFYIGTAIYSVRNSLVEVVSPIDYDVNTTGYGLYIFDCFAPSKLPTDGSVWLFGVNSSINGAGFTVQEPIEDESGMALEYPKNSTTIFKLLTDGIVKDTVYVSKYIKYGVFNDFTVILKHNNNPVVFTGLNDYGNREVVFAFDLHDSNMAMLVDYLNFVENLLEYSFPTIIESGSIVCGENININVISGCDSISVKTPSGDVKYLDIKNEVCEYKVTEVGCYNITVSLGDEEKVFNVYSSTPEEESIPSMDSTVLSLNGVAEDNYIDGIYDKLIILFIIILIVYAIDWMVYCYEQYQLR